MALQLAKKGKSVMMVDTDIEAPGLATLFFDEEAIKNGVLDYLLEHSLTTRTDITSYVLDVIEPSLLNEENGKLYILPAGKVDENYLQKLARIDYQDHREGALRKAMCTMLEAIEEYYSVDYILIDARAGFHDMGGIAVSQLPHGVVLFGNSSRQSWDGITQVVRIISENHIDHMPIVITDCMCDNTLTTAFMQEKEFFTRKAYEVCAENYYGEDEELPEISGKESKQFPGKAVFDKYAKMQDERLITCLWGGMLCAVILKNCTADLDKMMKHKGKGDNTYDKSRFADPGCGSSAWRRPGKGREAWEPV